MDIIAITEVLDRISRHCPEAMYVYLQCVNRADAEGSVFFTPQQIEVDLSEDTDSFRTRLKKLARENLLEWHPFEKGFSVTLATVQDDA